MERTRREQLGELLDGDQPELYPDYHTHLRETAASICAASNGQPIVFVGRSLEQIHDYLLGLMHNSVTLPPLRLMQYSAPSIELVELYSKQPDAFAALFDYWEELQLSLAQLVQQSQPTSLVDIVSSGSTFSTIVSLLSLWSLKQKQPTDAVIGKVACWV